MTIDTSVTDGNWLSVCETPDGRELEYFVAGSEAGIPIVCHHGTPSTCPALVSWADAAESAGLYLIAYSRPGYGRSTRLRGRDIAHAANDTTYLLDHLGADTFVTAGWSGGGPYAIACGALMPDRCKAAASIAGVGLFGASDLDYLDGMGDENIAEWGAAIDGPEVLHDFLNENYTALQTINGPELAAAFGNLFSEVDRAALTGEFADQLATSMRWALSSGFDGWIDDDLAFVRPWGFELAALAAPVMVWHGLQDNSVPPSHAKWLDRHIRVARLMLEPEHGHVSLVTAHLQTIFTQLADFAC